MRAALLAVALLFLAWPAPAGEISDPKLTPGEFRADLTLEQICVTKWGKDARAVTAKMKQAVMDAYDIHAADCPSGKVEIDHAISRELGGADTIANLWPQCYEARVADTDPCSDAGATLPPSEVPEMGAHKKDRLENFLGGAICPGDDGGAAAMTLAQARAEIQGDWRVAYIEHFGPPKHVPKKCPRRSAGGGSGALTP